MIVWTRRLPLPVLLLVLLAHPVRAEEPGAGRSGFFRSYWYERGLEFGNPYFDGRFRVNSPETVLDPRFMYRSEPRENGMMLIRIDEDLALVEAAEFYCEIWGGHPGTANKRFTINGRTQYPLPEVGTAQGHCTHMYPLTPLKLTDLVNGYNALQFGVDKGTTFWGIFIVESAALRIWLKPDHPDLKKWGLLDFAARVKVDPDPDQPESLRLSLSGLPGNPGSPISEVEFQGYYEGYDENGNMLSADWHGFTKGRKSVSMLGILTRSQPFLPWDLTMLPDQPLLAARALVHFRDLPGLVFVTPVTTGIRVPARPGHQVQLFSPVDLPTQFWSRAGNRKSCSFQLAVPPEKIERAELHTVVWDGGRGTVENYFTLNGTPFPVAGKGEHDVIYTRLPVDPKLLKAGTNRVELLSDTEHHGIEVLYPGPALLVRSRK